MADPITHTTYTIFFKCVRIYMMLDKINLSFHPMFCNMSYIFETSELFNNSHFVVIDSLLCSVIQGEGCTVTYNCFIFYNYNLSLGWRIVLSAIIPQYFVFIYNWNTFAISWKKGSYVPSLPLPFKILRSSLPKKMSFILCCMIGL